MNPIRRGAGNQHLHREPDAYRAAVRRKLAANLSSSHERGILKFC